MRNERLNQIIVGLNDYAEPVTLRRICKDVGLKVTPYTRGLLLTLIDDRFVEYRLSQESYPPFMEYRLTGSGRALAQRLIVEAIENGGL